MYGTIMLLQISLHVLLNLFNMSWMNINKKTENQ